jgi:hypothetical protein
MLPLIAMVIADVCCDPPSRNRLRGSYALGVRAPGPVSANLSLTITLLDVRVFVIALVSWSRAFRDVSCDAIGGMCTCVAHLETGLPTKDFTASRLDADLCQPSVRLSSAPTMHPPAENGRGAPPRDYGSGEHRIFVDAVDRILPSNRPTAGPPAWPPARDNPRLPGLLADAEPPVPGAYGDPREGPPRTQHREEPRDPSQFVLVRARPAAFVHTRSLIDVSASESRYRQRSSRAPCGPTSPFLRHSDSIPCRQHRSSAQVRGV